MPNLTRDIEVRTFKKLHNVERTDSYFKFRTGDIDVTIDVDQAIINESVRVIREARTHA